ncbi:Glutathione-regulated potassium-efflux system kefB [Gossypium australe]|uniref:Glutathione-regulated potassium-efflux system kefB n=1 Tax=Gossypium australe TaxID=47621 RepID=A0A5B6VK97_9ROSI|nr:Glutathione-regulated potassium-efflux system kefB [Gossypium australe]
MCGSRSTITENPPSSSHCLSMATLSFNSTRIKSPALQSHKPFSKSHFSTKPNNVPFLFPSKTHPQLHHFKPNSISESSVSVPEEAFDDAEEDDPTSELSYLDSETDPSSVTEWELDFCSRPILDIRGKKIWELVVCDSSLSLQYTKYFPNNVINSVTLKDAMETISEDLGVPLPEKVRFFRSQMQTIISKSCKELGIKPVPSKRCLSLLLWLEERYETIYMRHPGFQKGSKPLLALDNPFPMELPENLFGEKWAFVQLPFSAIQEEISSLDERFVFGAGLDLDLLGIEVDDNTLIPGLAVASSRAKPLAGRFTISFNFSSFTIRNSSWMNGLEVCSVEADTSRGCLILSVGISTRYVYATYKKTPTTTSEAEAWEAAKKACGGLHFLAIQEDLDSDDCVGFWLLLDLPPPPV